MEIDRGGKSRRQTNQKNPNKQPKLTNKEGGNIADNMENEVEHMEAEVAAVIRVGLKDIVKEIQDFKTELKM